jgi:anti-anti-sigma factor
MRGEAVPPQSDDGFAVNVLAAPAAPSALVCLVGEIDLAASAALSDAADRLSAIAPATVVVDLAGVTFAGAALLNFLAALHSILPAGATLMVCRPAVDVRRVLQITGMNHIAVICDDLLAPDSASPELSTLTTI